MTYGYFPRFLVKFFKFYSCYSTHVFFVKGKENCLNEDKAGSEEAKQQNILGGGGVR